MNDRVNVRTSDKRVFQWYDLLTAVTVTLRPQYPDEDECAVMHTQICGRSLSRGSVIESLFVPKIPPIIFAFGGRDVE